MRQYILAFLLVISQLTIAQVDVFLNIEHKLGNQPFALQTPSTNNLGNNFNVTRLQYYISGLEIIHDGGTVTPVIDKYLLVNAKDSLNELLGNFNITSLEGIRFAIGVDAAKNHADPSSYPSTHPLAPKSPSMHWGWSAGYRFIAIEGKGGNSLAYTYEIHGLDDANYFIQTIPTSGVQTANGIEIRIVADYTRVLEDINVSSGLVVHGSTGQAKTALKNFAWYVFSSSDGNVSLGLGDDLSSQKFSFSPNPVGSDRLVKLENRPSNCRIHLIDITGKAVEVRSEGEIVDLGKLPSGVYILQIAGENQAPIQQKLILQ
ncbi:MAG: T9SS type A sorting domain-containing protein [Bacteroidota bacterium]|nr:T9SS type A sorting domain-containing protein [Bacteroidota bacterium]MDX5448717.1 T9SS type A sorting domain-containing protein [Bacteroidota bacterium]